MGTGPPLPHPTVPCCRAQHEVLHSSAAEEMGGPSGTAPVAGRLSAEGVPLRAGVWLRPVAHLVGDSYGGPAVPR